VNALVPFRPFAELLDFDQPFSRLFRDAAVAPARRWPSIDVRDAGDKIEIVAELPGYQPDQVEVTVHEGVLTIAASRKDESNSDDRGYLWRERRSSSLYRRLRLPEGASAEKVEASLSEGLLTVSVPKGGEPSPVKVAVTAPAKTDETPSA
jgi:HSP20 family protein